MLANLLEGWRGQLIMSLSEDGKLPSGAEQNYIMVIKTTVALLFSQQEWEYFL